MPGSSRPLEPRGRVLQIPPLLFEDRVRAESFGAVAELYDQARPTYPAALIDFLTAPLPESVLDVGCGTGIAARLLADRGCSVLGVEPDLRMAELARDKGIEVDVARFETWTPRRRRFELLTCAQAWHWVEPEAALAKAAEVLAPAARIALFWNHGRLPEPLRSTVAGVYARLAPEIEEPLAVSEHGERHLAIRRRLEDAAAFTAAETEVFPWSRTYSTQQWAANLHTHSNHQTLPDPQRGRLLDAIAGALDAVGGSFEMSYETVLITARRRST